MNPSVVAIGEAIVEIMRPQVDQPLWQPGEFVGPFPSGAPAIFADASARLGVATGFIGTVGADDFGRCIRERLHRDEVEISGLQTVDGYTTGAAFVAYEANGNRNFVFHLPHSAAALLAPAHLDRAYFAQARIVHITGSSLATSESMRRACYQAAQWCKDSGGRVSFDPNLRADLLGIDQMRAICEPILQLADLVLPSGSEATLITGEAEPLLACQALLRRGIALVALKQGDQGSTILREGSHFHAAPLPVEEVDPTGAGDCYAAAFVAGVLAEWELTKIARFANITGALAVTRRGPMEGAPTLAQVLAYL